MSDDTLTDDDLAEIVHTDMAGLRSLSAKAITALCSQHVYMQGHRVTCPWTKGQWITYLPTALLDL